jgi:putative lipoprotein (rSAM/lipoprotein system)
MRKVLGKLLLSTLAAFGLLSCDTTSGPEPTPEYACPYADYTLTGTVIDADSSKAIEGIKIRFSDYNNLTAFSDSSGTWRIEGRVVCGWRDSLHVTDVDGEANRGIFLPDSLLLNPRLIPPNPNWSHDKWYRGTFAQTDIVVTMKKNP